MGYNKKKSEELVKKEKQKDTNRDLTSNSTDSNNGKKGVL